MNNVVKSMALLVGGAIAGAAIALMLTPKTGEELRKEMRDLAEEAKKRTEDFCHQVKADIMAKCPQCACEEAPAAKKEA